jgi:hypothetical protein
MTKIASSAALALNKRTTAATGVPIMVDITFSFEGNVCVFKAITPEGEGWMGASQRVMAVVKATAYLDAAELAGLAVKDFFATPAPS